MHNLILFTVLLFSLLATLANAEQITSIDQHKLMLSDKDIALTLARSSEWLNLLHYEKKKNGNYAQQTMIDDDRYFLSPHGKTDSLAEMMATLNEIKKNVSAKTISDMDSPDADTSRKHASSQRIKCRFPARYALLTKHFTPSDSNAWQNSEPCEEYNHWRKQINGHSIKLIFPAAYLNSPSSMFGHTLLRIDPPDVELGSEWLSWAVNFGANIGSSDNSIMYAYRGLAGGYPGQFTIVPYFKKIKEYSRYENRDIWEYSLNLNEKEVDRFLAHFWELKDINFDYYFFDENCSYRLLELLEIARPQVRLTHLFSFSAIPINTIRSVYEAGLIKSKVYRPSKANELSHLAALLSPYDAQLAVSLSKAVSHSNLNKLSQLSDNQQMAVLTTAYKYLRYQRDGGERDVESASISFQLLQQIQQRLPGNSPTTLKDTATPVPPENGHKTRALSIQFGTTNKEEYLQAEFRATYHDLLDNQKGYLTGAQLELGKISLRQYENQSAKIQELMLLSILSVSPRDRFFKPLSWKVYLGSERTLFGEDSTLSTHLTAGVGYSLKLGNLGYIYQLATASVEHNEHYEQNTDMALGHQIGIHLHPSYGQFAIMGEQRFFSEKHREYKLRLLYHHSISTNQGLRIWYSRFGTNGSSNIMDYRNKESSVEYKYYF